MDGYDGLYLLETTRWEGRRVDDECWERLQDVNVEHDLSMLRGSSCLEHSICPCDKWQPKCDDDFDDFNRGAAITSLPIIPYT